MIHENIGNSKFREINAPGSGPAHLRSHGRGYIHFRIEYLAARRPGCLNYFCSGRLKHRFIDLG